MRNISDTSCREYQNIHLCSVTFFLFLNLTFYEIMWKNIVERGRPQMTIRPMCIACWITKATNTNVGCVILVASPLQQWLNERVSLLRYTYIADIVNTSKPSS